MAAEKINAETRTEFGKGAARRIRRENKIPAVVYGHGNEPDPRDPAGPRHDDGAQARRRQRAARARHRRQDPARADQAGPGRPDQAARSSTSTSSPSARARRSPSTCPSTSSARPPGRRWSSPRTPRIQLEAEATHIPEFIEVGIEGAEAGTQIHASDLDLPEGSTLLLDPETLIVNITEQPSQEALEAELEEAEAEAGIERDERRAETAEDEAAAAEGEASAEGGEGAPRSDPPPAQAVPGSRRPVPGHPPGADSCRRRVAGGRAGQPRPDVRRPPAQRRLPRRRRAGRADGLALPAAQVRPRRRRRGPAGAPGTPGRGSCWPGRAAT